MDNSVKGDTMKKTSLITLLFLLAFITHIIIKAEDNVYYKTAIKQLISEKGCEGCHFFTRSYENLLSQKINGIPLVNVAKPDSSVLIWKIEGKTQSGDPFLPRMPASGDYFSEEEINIFKTWIAQGALEDIVVDVEKSTHTWSGIKLKFK